MSTRRLSIHLLLVLSGFAGLGYQIVWIRTLSAGLGHEAVAMLAVVAAFFAGLTLGAAAFDRAIARSPRPDQWYAWLEIAIGVWALALIWAIPAAGDALATAIGPAPSATRHWLWTFAGPFLLLAPATVAMGATLPAAERMEARLRTGSARDAFGGLYAANVLGAALGAAATLAFLGPLVGFNGALAVFALANFAVAALALRLGRRMAADAAPPRSTGPGPDLSRTTAIAALAATGLLGIGYEVAVARALAQTLENTVYSFAAVVVVYLAGAAIGAAAWQVAARRVASTRRAAMVLCAGLSAACLLGSAAALNATAIYDAAYRSLGEGGWARWGAEAVVVGVVFLPPAVLMGALFPALASAARRPGGGVGPALAVNMAGAAPAPFVVGVALTPLVGVIGAMGVLAGAYGVLAAAFARGLAPRRRAAWALLGPGCAAALLALVDLRLTAPAEGETLVLHREGPSSAASVYEAPSGARRLVVDGRFAMGGDATEAMDRLQGHIPLLLHPAPHNALFLGLGAGATFAAATDHPGLRATAVELSAPVVDTLPLFAEAGGDILTGDNATVIVGDARRFVRAVEDRFDVIVADTFHPARDGAAMLYTREHFAAVRARLADGGLFAQWLPLHQFDLDMLRSVAATFQSVFPDAGLHVANASLSTPLLALVGRRDAGPPTLDALAARVGDGALRREAEALGLDTAFALLGAQIAGPDSLRAFAEGAPINRDAWPVVLFEAPSTVYGGLEPAERRLLALVDALEVTPADAFAAAPSDRDATFAERLSAYWRARDAFLQLGSRLQITGDAEVDARRLAPELLRIAAISPDYAPAQRPILGLAMALAAVDPEGAASLLEAAAPLTPTQTARVAALRARIGAITQ